MELLPLTVLSPGRRAGIPCYQSRRTESPPRFAAVLVHGLGDQGRALPYRWLAEALESDLLAVAGHGRSLAPGVPLIAIGLSMGVLVAIRAGGRDPSRFAGIAAAAAPLGPVAPGRAPMMAARVLGRVLPWLPSKRASTWPRSPATPRRWRSTPPIPCSRGERAWDRRRACRAVIPGLRHFAAALTVPALFLHGRRDRIASWVDGIGEDLERAGQTVCLFDEGHHNLFLDHGRSLVWNTIVQWASGLPAARD